MNTNKKKSGVEKLRDSVQIAKSKALLQVKRVEKELLRLYEERPGLQGILTSKPVERVVSRVKGITARPAVEKNPIQQQREKERKAQSVAEQQSHLPSRAMRRVTIRANAELGIPVSESLASRVEKNRHNNPFTEKPTKGAGHVMKDRIIKVGLAAAAGLAGTAAAGSMTYDSIKRGERLASYEQQYAKEHTSQEVSYDQAQELAHEYGLHLSAKAFELPDGTIVDKDALLEFGQSKTNHITVRLKGALAKKFSLVKVTATSQDAFSKDPNAILVDPAGAEVRFETATSLKHYTRIYLQVGEDYTGNVHDLFDSSRFLPLLEVRESESWEGFDL